MPFNQKQIIEQAKFTYSLVGKSFEEQIKTIKDQAEKQIKAIKGNRKQLVKSNKDIDKNNTSHKRLEDIFLDELSYERME